MNPPPMLLAAAVLFWGWQSGQWWLAAGVAVLLEAPKILGVRLAFSVSDLNRASNLSTWLLIIVAAYLYFRVGAAQVIIETIQWLPLVVLPLFAAIAWGGMQSVDLGIISLAMRRRAQNDVRAAQIAVDLAYPYVALWTLAASVSNQSGWGFYLGLLGFCAWVLWRIRPRGRSPLLWSSVLLIAAIGGGLINHGLYRLQELVEQIALDWISGDSDEDSERTRTSLGHIGQLKLSDSIVLRVSSSQPSQPLPLLLRTASYNVYSAAAWLVSGDAGFRDKFRALPQESSQAEWQLNERAQSPSTLEVYAASSRAKALIALPAGSVRVVSPQFTRMSRNSMGTVQAEMPPGHYAYRVVRDAAILDRAAPLPEDLKLPREDSALLLETVRRLRLEGKPAVVVLPLLKNYFAENFSYSTFRAGNAMEHTALADFLVRNRSGHCEHFATATVMLLRAAGVPARYAVGFSVQEESRFGNGYVARKRDAHAWVSVYVNGAWRDFDTTPAAWPGMQSDSAPIWEPLLDAWSWLWFQMGRMQVSGYEFFAYALGLLGMTWLGRELVRRRGGFMRTVQRVKKSAAKAPPLPAEAASAFYRIEAMLAERGLSRPNHEPLTLWLARIAPQLGEEAAGGLARIVALHYRCRFGPQCLQSELRDDLRSASREWIERFGASRPTR